MIELLIGELMATLEVASQRMYDKETAEQMRKRLAELEEKYKNGVG